MNGETIKQEEENIDLTQGEELTLNILDFESRLLGVSAIFNLALTFAYYANLGEAREFIFNNPFININSQNVETGAGWLVCASICSIGAFILTRAAQSYLQHEYTKASDDACADLEQ